MWRHRTTGAAVVGGRPPRIRAIVAALAVALVVGPVPGLTSFAKAVEPCSAEAGQAFIDAGRYDKAVREFTCVIAAAPTEIEGYRGRAEALLLLGRFSDAYRDYYRGIVAFVLPVHPDAAATIYAGYDARLAATPDSIPALTGASFARWVFFAYPQAIRILDTLLEVRPDDIYGTLFRGSSRVLQGVTTSRGVADLERAIALAPTGPDVRYVVADAYTYGSPDPQRAFDEATRALAWGLDTPRVHAILAAAHTAFGETLAAAAHIERHISLVTTERLPAPPLTARATLQLDLAPGRVYDIPVPATAGSRIRIVTGSRDFVDTIALLLAPDGTLVAGSDDDKNYFAAFDLTARTAGTYTLRVTSFEAVDTGRLRVDRDRG